MRAPAQDRPTSLEVPIDYVGFEIPDEFVVGYGLITTTTTESSKHRDTQTRRAARGRPRERRRGNSQSSVRRSADFNIAQSGQARPQSGAHQHPPSRRCSPRTCSDGELVMLVLKPSFGSSTDIPVVHRRGAAALRQHPPRFYRPIVQYVEACVFVIAGRVMLAVLQWMGRLYILTGLAHPSTFGIFSVNIFDCPLRRVARNAPASSMRERIFRLGSIESSCRRGCGIWAVAMVAHPKRVHDRSPRPSIAPAGAHDDARADSMA